MPEGVDEVRQLDQTPRPFGENRSIATSLRGTSVIKSETQLSGNVPKTPRRSGFLPGSQSGSNSRSKIFSRCIQTDFQKISKNGPRTVPKLSKNLPRISQESSKKLQESSKLGPKKFQYGVQADPQGPVFLHAASHESSIVIPKVVPNVAPRGTAPKPFQTQFPLLSTRGFQGLRRLDPNSLPKKIP